MKLKSSIPSNSVKLIELYNKIVSGTLITGPDYQRKLVWKKQHKYSFIETILLNFPFPEVYIASSDMDLATLQSREVVVDGQQRLTTIVDYIKGSGDFEKQTKVQAFDDLSIDEKREFLNYLITVKDLKDIGSDKIKEVFKRINSTDYSLNSNEILNAEFGGGEFALFCKLLADKRYEPTEKETDILIEDGLRSKITSFFERNQVFSENDIRRMFDSQYIMLIACTILEGGYFGRSSKINYYLEKYNFEFNSYKDLLLKIENSINIIDKLNFSKDSYWFNKANLFTLMVELNAVNETNINTDKLEHLLINLENKVDIYFNGDEQEMKLLSSDETKYFEVSRHGSHELSAREHRGKVVKEIIQQAIPEPKNILLSKIDHAILIPTNTGLTKSIMDATSSVRNFLLKNAIHDYENQEYGPTHKKKVDAQFIQENLTTTPTEASLYRSNGRGDYRIWFSELKTFAESNDELVLIVLDNKLSILNITKFEYSEFLNNIAEQKK